ncbi:unnamed protein product [Paramecium octaurelia]|uniref:Uncharacterized protein n=1 Tax=Paramecium octaurelia TaxID=43137 RepID=A0A8S1WM03_PAROT|nr:unnamed protein product [Paramecium octaurelia]
MNIQQDALKTYDSAIQNNQSNSWIQNKNVETLEKMIKFEISLENYDLEIQLKPDQNVKAHTLFKTPTTLETVENQLNQLCTFH